MAGAAIIHFKSKRDDVYIEVGYDFVPFRMQGLLLDLASGDLAIDAVIAKHNKLNGDVTRGHFNRFKEIGVFVEYVYEVRKPENGPAAISISEWPWREVEIASAAERGLNIEELRQQGRVIDCPRDSDKILHLCPTPFYAGSITEYAEIMQPLTRQDCGMDELAQRYQSRLNAAIESARAAVKAK